MSEPLSEQTPSRASQASGYIWPALVIALLGAQIVVCGVVLFVATSDPSVAVEPNYYSKSLGWDAARQAQRSAEALGWNVELTPEPAADAIGRRMVRCDVRDGQGRPLQAATVQLVAMHHARARERVQLTLQATGDGSYSAVVPMQRAGQWELRVSVSHGGHELARVIQWNCPEP